MTPGARLATAIEILGEVLAHPGRPADAVVGDYLRQRKFIGGGDRRAISERVYGVLRRRAQIEWWLEHARHTGEVSPRMRVFADGVLTDGLIVERMEKTIDAGRYRPASLTDAERATLKRLEGHTLDHPAQSRATRLNVPAWVEPHLDTAFGATFEREVAALSEPAPVDLRVNPLKGGRAEARAALAEEGIEVHNTKLSPLGLRLKARASVVATQPFRDGLIEVQDEGSQLVGLLVGARPAMQVVDFCAGAGGKTLAIAASMENKGRVVACDVSAFRLERSAQRLRRAGVHNVERRTLDAEGRKWLKRHAGKFDRVLVDAPCTGIGTWRRNPDARWTLKPEDIAELPPKQGEILATAAKLVKPGGRLVYATCSLLPVENEAQVADFLAAHPDFAAVPIADAWQQNVGTAFPDGAASGDWLRLTPARHHTDGFFVAVLERKA
ncbi:RsmB/NOP family class I SAM-dependent RNA methyltransferase [Vineibacter terrae]|uniref:RsmB/NOP family class I SAM-dependent RNA methyltransferase n=1 Tax=Vineibacter terrae TaxID=2586908 RepID=UPI002E379175|nr:RsmB/NOP family class I SAM-dependent RNA methyltransferase [Vineibacter terrae]HEX2891989.1 RsmB/NOP family class I SAM-dependent RNA methyltransferase [Vineibacter terrae]